MADSRAILQAMDILRGWPWFRDQYVDVHHFHARLILPNRTGRLRVLHLDGGRMFYTWTKLDEPCFDLPSEEHWSKDGAMLWLCDMVYDKGVSSRQAVEACGNDMIDQGVAEDGQKIFFYRGSQERYGYGTVRRRQDTAERRAAQ